MKEENLVTSLISLVKGETAPQAWIKWWQDNADTLEKLLPRTAYLKIKPNTAFGETRAALISQAGAHAYLEKTGIKLNRSEAYSKEWLVDFSREIAEEKKRNSYVKDIFSSEFTSLKKGFPKFFDALQSHLVSQDNIIIGKSIDEVKAKEESLQFPISADLNLFFESVSILDLEGVRYDFTNVRQMQIGHESYLAWGEYWLEGDGDLVLIDANDIVYYLNHSQSALQPRQLASNFRVFVEKELINFIVDNSA